MDGGTVTRVLDMSGKLSFDSIRVEVVKDCNRLRRKFVFDWHVCILHGERMLDGTIAKDPQHIDN